MVKLFEGSSYFDIANTNSLRWQCYNRRKCERAWRI